MSVGGRAVHSKSSFPRFRPDFHQKELRNVFPRYNCNGLDPKQDSVPKAHFVSTVGWNPMDAKTYMVVPYGGAARSTFGPYGCIY